MQKNWIFVCLGLVVVFILGLWLRQSYPNFQAFHIPMESQDADSSSVDGNSMEDLESYAQEILELLANQDFDALSLHVGEGGLYLLPYPVIWENQPQILSTGELLSLVGSEEVLTRGTRDGSGHPITGTFAWYYERFVWNADFLSGAEILRGENIPDSRGNTIVDLGTIFPGAEVIEYYLPGIDPQYDGIDWQSLYLIFVP